MTTLREQEGYLLVDHRDSPGIPDEIAVANGLPPGVGNRTFEAATFTCSHCQAVVVKHPWRERERGYCRKCQHLVCDVCEAKRVASGGECYPMKARMQDMAEAFDKGLACESFIIS